MSLFSFRGRSSNVRGIGKNVQATRASDMASSRVSSVSGDSGSLPAPPVFEALSDFVMTDLAKSGRLENVLAERNALWKAYYASCQSAVRNLGGSAVSSEYSTGVCSDAMKEKFASLGILRRAASNVSVSSSASSEKSGKVAEFVAGVDTKPGDYAKEESISRYGEGACYLNVVRQGYVAEVHAKLGPRPSLAKLLSLPMRCFIQFSGLQYRMCAMQNGGLHVRVGSHGASFLDVLVHLRGAGAELPRWAMSVATDYTGPAFPATLTLSTLVGGPSSGEKGKVSVQSLGGQRLSVQSRGVNAASLVMNYPALCLGDDVLIPQADGVSTAGVPGDILVGGKLCHTDNVVKEVQAMFGVSVVVTLFGIEPVELLLKGNCVRDVVDAVRARHWDYLIKTDGVHVWPAVLLEDVVARPVAAEAMKDKPAKAFRLSKPFVGMPAAGERIMAIQRAKMRGCVGDALSGGLVPDDNGVGLGVSADVIGLHDSGGGCGPEYGPITVEEYFRRGNSFQDRIDEEVAGEGGFF